MRTRLALTIGLLLALSCGPDATAPRNTGVALPQPPLVPSRVAPTLRLPPVAKPSHYDLDLTLDPSKPTYPGVVSVQLTILAATDVIWMNATDLKVTAVTSTAGGTPRVVPGNEDFIGFAFDAPLAAGTNLTLAVSFEGKVDPEKPVGLYSQKEADGQAYLYTFFEPLDARRAFPCFDEPGYKVPWKLTIHTRSTDVARSNARVASETPEPNAMKAVKFEDTKPIPSYLVAFIVGPFDVAKAPDAGHHNTPLAFILPRGRGAESHYAASVTPKIIGLLEDYFGMPYPWVKLDVAVNPRFWGTMEHPGMVSLGQPLTLMKPTEESTGRKQLYTDIAAHELSHYWFGDYVTNAWWDDTWLNESMGQWMDVKIASGVEPAWRYGRERLVRAQGAMTADELPSAKRIREPVKTRDDINNAFDGDLTYNKGATLLDMLEKWMTPTKMQHAIRAYMGQHAFGNATAEDLFAAIDAEAGPSASAAFRSFVDQPGVPIVRAEVVCEGAKKEIVLSQKRFVPAGMTLPAETWKIPVCMRYGGAGEPTRTCSLLEGESTHIVLDANKTCPTWVLLKEEGIGYYRSKYDKPALDRLVGTKGLVKPEELASVIDDAGALVRSGDLGLDDAMAFLPTALTSRDRYVVTMALSTLSLARFMATPPQREKLAAFVRTTLAPRAKALGWTKKAGDDLDDERARPVVLGLAAITGHDPALWREGREQGYRWIKDRQALDPDVAAVALRAGARTNDPAFFDSILAEARRITERRDKIALFTSLGAFTDPALVKRAHALVLGKEEDLRDVLGILYEQLEDPDLFDIGYAFYDTNYDVLNARLREDEAGWTFNDLAWTCDEKHLEAIQAAFTPRAQKVPGAPRNLAGAVERIRLCITQKQANSAKLDAFLKKN